MHDKTQQITQNTRNIICLINCITASYYTNKKPADCVAFSKYQ